MKKKFQRNVAVLEKNNIRIVNDAPVWDDKPDSVEMQTYTPGGEDMFICLDEPSQECLEEYIDDFDINEHVLLWWQGGTDAAHAKGVPFDNIRDHYNDYEAYLDGLRKVAELLD